MAQRALSPTHITGFFEIRDTAPDPLRRGSKGAGVCLALEVETEASLTDEPGAIRVKINGIPSQALVSRDVANRLLTLSGRRRGLKISHTIPVPIGSGFGTSGAGALGTALAGSEALGLGLSTLEAGQLAHRVEVERRTGLGTVAGEFYGGIEVRAREGAPGFGEVFRISDGNDYSVVTLHNGPMETSRLLSDPVYRAKINSVGGIISAKILENPRLDSFLLLSHEFSVAVGLETGPLSSIMSAMEGYGYNVGTAMFGHTLFTVVRKNESLDVARLMGKTGVGRVIVGEVSPRGARLS